jgi:hypothetical protein
MISLQGRVARVVLALVPPTMLTLAIPLVNRVEPRIFGVPFLLAWIVLWSLLAPLFLYSIYRIEGRHL